MNRKLFWLTMNFDDWMPMNFVTNAHNMSNYRRIDVYRAENMLVTWKLCAMEIEHRTFRFNSQNIWIARFAGNGDQWAAVIKAKMRHQIYHVDKWWSQPIITVIIPSCVVVCRILFFRLFVLFCLFQFGFMLFCVSLLNEKKLWKRSKATQIQRIPP